jgi:hypothetical protein
LKSSKYDDFTRPVVAFITFEYEDSYDRACKYKDPKYRKDGKVRGEILGQPMVMTAATEPTNIIWENRCITDNDRKKRTCIAYLLILFMLCSSFGIITWISTSSIKLN